LQPRGFEEVRALVDGRARVSQEIGFDLDTTTAAATVLGPGKPVPGTSVIVRVDGGADRIRSRIVRWSFDQPRVSVGETAMTVETRFGGYALQQVGAHIAESFARRVGLPVRPATTVSNWIGTEAGLDATLTLVIAKSGRARCFGTVHATAFPDIFLAVLITRGPSRLLDAVVLNKPVANGRTYGVRGRRDLAIEPVEFAIAPS
jgi:hypothetical protein